MTNIHSKTGHRIISWVIDFVLSPYKLEIVEFVFTLYDFINAFLL